MDVLIDRGPSEIDFSVFRGQNVIGIDGDNGAGKSTLAREISDAIGGAVVSVDDFLLGNGKPYVSQLDMSRLSNAIQEAARPVIIEGVLLQDVLRQLELNIDYLVFVQCKHEGVAIYGTPTKEIREYYLRQSPWLIAQLIVILRKRFIL